MAEIELIAKALGEFPVLLAFMAWAYVRDRQIDKMHGAREALLRQSLESLARELSSLTSVVDRLERNPNFAFSEAKPRRPNHAARLTQEPHGAA